MPSTLIVGLVLKRGVMKVRASLRGFAAAGLGALLGFGAMPASAEVLKADGVQVDLQIPDGFCALSRTNDADKAIYEFQDRTQAKYNGVMLIALPCDEIKAAREGKPWKRWVIWLINGAVGNHSKIPPGVSRKDVMAELERAAPAIDVEEIKKKSGEVAAGEGIGLKLQTMSTIGKDDLALYSAQALKVNNGATERDIAVVFGWLALEERLFTVNAYSDLKGVASVETLLAQVKDMVKRTVEKTEVKSPADGGRGAK